MRTSRSLSTRLATMGGALALAASGLVGAVGLGAVGLVATSTVAGATSTPLSPTTCNLNVAGTVIPTVLTPTVNAVISPASVSAGQSFSLSTLGLTSNLVPTPQTAALAGSTLGIEYDGTLTATGASPASEAVAFTGSVAIPAPFNAPVPVSLTGAAGSFTAASDGSKSVAVSLSGAGQLVATTVAGPITGPCSGTAAQIATAPIVAASASITNVIPNAGPIAGGTTVKIVGQNFGGATSVLFGSQPATSFKLLTANVIQAVAPAITTDGNTTQTPVDIQVVTSSGPSAIGSADTFTYVDPALGVIVNSVTPIAGPNGGGNTVLITGSGFNDPNGGPATDVFFGNVDLCPNSANPCSNFTVIDDSHMTAVAPPGTGIVDVRVVGGDFVTKSPVSPQDHYNYAPGYFLAGADGGVFSYGQVPGQSNFFGSAGALKLNKPVVGIAVTPDGGGYWLVASDGGVFAYGDAGFFGSAGALKLNQPVVAMVATPDGLGYWLIAADGGIFSYGDAFFYGSMGGQKLNAPIVGAAPGKAVSLFDSGYYLVAADGGVFNFGPGTTFSGSAGGTKLNKPMVAMAASPTGGYLLAASDGGVFAYGGAKFSGSLGGTALSSPVAGITGTADGGGYWLTTQSGAVFNKGNAGFYGDLSGIKLNGSIVGLGAVQTSTLPAATVPGAPTGVSAVPADSSATVSFTAALGNGSPVTGYTVTATDTTTPANGGQTCATPDGNTTSCTFSGLTNGDTYTFTVTATNSVGTGPASAPSSPVTPPGT